jgi:hypothetical protein
MCTITEMQPDISKWFAASVDPYCKRRGSSVSRR